MFNLKTLITRTITGILFVAILIGGILYHPLSFVVVFALIEFLSLNEFFKFCRRSQSSSQTIYGSLVGLYVFVSGFLWHYMQGGQLLSFLIFPLLVFLFVWELYRNKKHPMINIATTLLGIIYISLPLNLLSHIAWIHGEYNGKLVLGLFIIMWATDTGAYVFGVLFGKHRLFERISPKKSWEGFFGGFIVAGITAYLLTLYYGVFMHYEWYVIAFLLVVFGTLGDLTESLFKRSINIKDSGKLLPGHGGILDRFDSILFAIPIIYTYLYIVGLQ